MGLPSKLQDPRFPDGGRFVMGTHRFTLRGYWWWFFKIPSEPHEENGLFAEGWREVSNHMLLCCRREETTIY